MKNQFPFCLIYFFYLEINIWISWLYFLIPLSVALTLTFDWYDHSVALQEYHWSHFCIFSRFAVLSNHTFFVSPWSGIQFSQTLPILCYPPLWYNNCQICMIEADFVLYFDYLYYHCIITATHQSCCRSKCEKEARDNNVFSFVFFSGISTHFFLTISVISMSTCAWRSASCCYLSALKLFPLCVAGLEH